jgi:hypothetical protein
MNRGCYTSYMLSWDHGDFATYRPVQERFEWREFADDMLGDMGECTISQQSRSGHTHIESLMQYLPICEKEWESMLIDCITILSRV